LDNAASKLSNRASRNTVKVEAIPGATHHVFNRGVERRLIFKDSHDYRRFKAQLRQALEREPGVELWAYCLMPNHFHLLIHQAEATSMGRFMQRLTVGYVMYVNKRQDRIGPLFQGKYKAVRVLDDRQLMEVSRYIHLNPERAGLGWRQHQHSSLSCYLEGVSEGGLAKPGAVLRLFDLPSDYRRYLSIGKVGPQDSPTRPRHCKIGRLCSDHTTVSPPSPPATPSAQPAPRPFTSD
jgi:putative transposase